MTELIKTYNITKKFGDMAAVKNISLSVRKGEVLGFLGPNGAGKSTTMKIITGFIKPDYGSVDICGVCMADNPLIAKSKIGYLPEGAPAYCDMTPRTLLHFIAEIRGFYNHTRDKKVAQAAQKTGLYGVLDQNIDTLSKGYKRRVGLAHAILHDPDILILDEPTDGLDPNQKYQVRKLISEMAPHKAIIVSTHILEEVEAVCSRAIIIDKGQIVADGTAESLMGRMPYHKSVALSVAQEDADKIKVALYNLVGVIDVEEISRHNGRVRLRVFPKSQISIVDEIAELVRNQSIAVDELFVERGKLDDVFRQVTSSDFLTNSSS
ncbi:MAG: Linearmycin resistance ATP-binding protein LnrL [Hyphomicrobiaceae bacterium hypho_1]